MPEILFAAESAESRSLPLNAQRLVNFFTEKQQPGAKSQTPLFGVPGMSAFADTESIIGAIAGLGTITGGSGYGVGTYSNVPLTGGSGTGATANITITTGAVSAVVLVNPGINYQVGDVVSALSSSLGGAGSGFSVPVSALGGQGIAAVGGFISAGSGYNVTGGIGYPATAYNVPVTGGSGSGALATVYVNMGVVQTFTVTTPGINYLVGDVVSFSNPFGGPGAGFSAPVATLSGGGIATFGSITGGSGYDGDSGTFTNVPLTGGSGAGAVATVGITTGGAVATVVVTFPGIDYLVGDVLSASNANLGGSGSGFSVPVAAINTPGPVRGSWVKQDIPYIVAGNSLYQLGNVSTGTYNNVPLTGGSGSGATANLTVVAGVITAAALVSGGINYQVGDILSAPLGAGTGFLVPVATLSGAVIALLGTITGGAGYVSATYYGVPLTGGSGSGATATVTVTNGAVGAVQLATPGTGYVIGDVLSASNANLGGTGSGFSVTVAEISGVIATLGAITGGTNYQVATCVLVGSGISGTDIVGMSDNGFQLCIVSGQAKAGWILDTNPQSTTYGFQQITDPNFYPANTVSFFDGYFVFDRLGTNEFFVSNLYDGTTYNGLLFASAESQPDFVTGTVQNLQLLFVICQQHLELWYDAGNASPTFPFQRYTGSGISYGCVSPHTIIKQDGAIFFLSSDKIFYRLQSTVPIRVSTHPMEHIIAQDPDITQAYCFTYTLEGHKFVVLQLPASKRTLVFDISTNRWAERESWDANNNSLGAWRATTAFNAFNNFYLGDGVNGKVNLLDWTTYTELGNTIRGLAYSIPYHQDRKRLFVSRFELDIQAGVGTAYGPGSNPQIQLGWSIDGANTFNPLQFWRSMGQIGQYLQRLRWLRMGTGRQFVFVLSCTDPVPRVIISAHADISIGM